MKEYIISVMEKNRLVSKLFYFDKTNLLKNGNFDTISISVLVSNGILFTAHVKRGMYFHLNLTKGKESIISFDFANYEDCMEMYELIVGKHAAKTLDSNLSAYYWKDKITHNVQDESFSIGTPNNNLNFEYEPR